MGRGKSQRSLDLIDAAREILQEIQPATVRAVCYRLFTMGLIDCMAKSETNRVGTQLVWAREQGIIPWAWIVDETREAERQPGWADPEAFIRAARRSYRRDRWQYQPSRVEVWSEKGTVRGTLAPVLEQYGVTFRVMHGYASASVIYQVAQETREADAPLIALYVGDWDPSGLHMSEEDLPHRLDNYDAFVELTRVALTEADVSDAALPPFAAETKRGDTRYRWYVCNYGPLCWELDAMSPPVLRDRVAGAIRAHIESEAWERCGRGEQAEQASLAKVLSRWKSICGQASKYGVTP